MPSTDSVAIPILDGAGQQRGVLRLALLPSANPHSVPAPLLDLRGDPFGDPELEPVQLLEGEEYLYEFELLAESGQPVWTDKPEIFQPDTAAGTRGRLRTGLYVGKLPVTIYQGEAVIGHVALEVRSRKLDYLHHYRWMLRDLAEAFAELIMERFAPTEQRFAVDTCRDPGTLYQRFVFLKSLLADGTLEAAIHQILTSPHRAWVSTEEWRRPGQHLPASAGVVRQFGAAGPRLPWPDAPSHLSVQSLPEKFQVQRTKETLDTPENRFVKFALLRWRKLAVQIYEALAQEAPRYPVQRGLREIQGLLDFLDTFLAAELFQEVGPLTFLPANSQVLQKRAGYRDVFRIFLQVEAAALLAWEGGEAIYGAGQRDVAALYEAWAFLQLARIVSRFCQVPFDLASLIETRPDGLGVNLKQGRHKVLRGTLERLSRTLEVELWYNRYFSPADAGSWTRPMRPDCSLWIRPKGAPPQVPGVWLHFDAKYRVDSLVELFGATPPASGADAEFDEGTPTVDGKRGPTRGDLLKMHAYRDAIRRTAGAYILYPGTENQQFTVYHELLPGLGAFVLRPTETGAAAGQEHLVEFLDAVFTHVASQVTHHERWRYWTQAIYQAPPVKTVKVPALPELSRPPADTLVLLGYVRDEQHLQWIRTLRLYNLEVDEETGSLGLSLRELAVDFVLLCGPPLTEGELWQVAGEPRLLSGRQLAQLRYPHTPGALCFCLPLRPLPTRLLPSLAPPRIEAFRRQPRAGALTQETAVVTMWELMVGAGGTDTGNES
nr:MAG: hypothetical protein DIU70_05100 [Bacillota bacterium]